MAVRATRTGGGAAGRDQRGALDGNRHAGEHCPLFIGRRPGNRPGLLGKRRGDRKQRERDQNCGLTHGESPHEAESENRDRAAVGRCTGQNARHSSAAAP